MKVEELTDLLGVSKSTIRYFEDHGLVNATLTKNKQNDYSDEEVILFQKIIVLRKLGVSIPELRDIIGGKAELCDVLNDAENKLQRRQEDSAAAIEISGNILRENPDFESFEPSKYLRMIYEAEQEGCQFSETREMSFRELNLAITLLGAAAGMAIPQNKEFSEHSNDPIPDDIRGNQKEGDEYDTIGDVLRKGGKRKIIVIGFIIILVLMMVLNGLGVWGGLIYTVRSGIEYYKSGIELTETVDNEIGHLAGQDSDRIYDEVRMFKFHVRGGMHLIVKVSEDGKWATIDEQEIGDTEGYISVAGDPSSEIVVHVTADGKSTIYNFNINDDSYINVDTFISLNEENQTSLSKVQPIALFLRDESIWTEAEVGIIGDPFDNIVRNAPADRCYALFVQSIE